MFLSLARRAAVVALALGGTVAAHAHGAIYNPTVSNTAVPNGDAQAISGTLNDGGARGPEPWVAQVYKGPGECLRLFVSTTAFDSALSVGGPDGAVWRNDDSFGSQRPLVVVDAARRQGWYTVQVAHFSGRTANANFTLNHGRYVAGNINCQPVGGQ